MNNQDITRIKRYLAVYYKKLIQITAGKPDIEANLQMKYFHSFQVHALAQKLGVELHLDQQSIFQVRAAALLHDIGRFPQIIESQTYEDENRVDHADLGVKIIHDNGVIDHLGSDISRTIKTAVQNHNKLALPEELSRHDETIAKVLRDADKIDIIRIAIEFYSSELEGNKTGWFSEVSFSRTCSRMAANALVSGKAVSLNEISTVYDEFILYLSWVNDLHFDYSVWHLVSLGSWEYMVNAIPDDMVRNQITTYIRRRIHQRCSTHK